MEIICVVVIRGINNPFVELLTSSMAELLGRVPELLILTDCENIVCATCIKIKRSNFCFITSILLF